jgi:hypothetical protein
MQTVQRGTEGNRGPPTRDNPAPQLTPDQKALISALEATGKPVIVVVIAGRPLSLGPAEQANAVLMAYQGSREAGQAVADAIFGKIDPSGKLPVTWPSDAAALDGDFNSGAPRRSATSPRCSTSYRAPTPVRAAGTTRCTSPCPRGWSGSPG